MTTKLDALKAAVAEYEEAAKVYASAPTIKNAWRLDAAGDSIDALLLTDDTIATLVDVAVSSDRLAEIAEFAADDDDCEYDHHGYCQVHGCGDMGDRETPHCPTAALKEQVIIVRAALAKLEEEA